MRFAGFCGQRIHDGLEFNARPFGTMQRIFQAAAWLLAGTIVVLSLRPASVRPMTGAQHDLEHLLIFLATGMAFGFGYPDRFRLLTFALLTFAAAIEVAQIWAPGRHARISDFLVDAAASCLGVGLSYAFVRLFNPRFSR
jgi:VanZ family protein